MKKTLDNIAFWTIYGIWYLLSLLPMWLHYLFSDILYLIVAHVLRYRHRVVWKNLSTSYPDKSEQELKKLQRQFYRHMCDLVAETIKYTTISDKNIMRRMTFKGSEQVAEILNGGQSVALLLGHYGNWEWVSSLVLWLRPLVNENVIMGQIYHPLENKVFNRVVLKTRGRMGSDSVAKNDTLRWILGNKRDGHPTILGYINDQVPKWENIHHWLTFLNHKDTPVFTGIERIVHSQNQAAVYVDVKHVGRGRYECEYHVITCHPEQMGEFELTNIYFQRMEQTINRAPQYWLWSHNRWKRTREEFDRRFKVVRGRVVEKSPDET
jgi:KDO2-lipid IV(A) lauroyltransferase